MEEIIKSLLASGSLTAILFLILWFWFSERLKDAIRRENEKELAEHKAKIDHEYNEKLAAYTAKLAHDKDLNLELFRNQLERKAAEQNFRFSRVFDKTAEILAETYKQLVDLNQTVVGFTLTVSSESETKAALQKAYEQKADQLYAYLLPNKLYIPRDTSTKILDLARTINRSAMQYSIAVQTANALERTSETSGRLFNQFFESSDQIPKLMEALEIDFQRILGFPDEPAGQEMNRSK
jgi:methyl-accepting chemotaxis protein